jgi:hypothetical protein
VAGHLGRIIGVPCLTCEITLNQAHAAAAADVNRGNGREHG